MRFEEGERLVADLEARPDTERVEFRCRCKADTMKFAEVPSPEGLRTARLAYGDRTRAWRETCCS